MRNVVVYMLLSLDGVAEEPGERLFTDADPKRTLQLLDATTTAGGSLFLRYGTGS